MIFSKQAIQKIIQQKRLVISPFSEEQVEAAHINLHVSTPNGKVLTIAPKDFVIAQTKEAITLAQNLCAFMEGRAGLAKQGVSIEQSSTFIEPGSSGRMTLEIFNAGDSSVELQDGQPIAKMFVMAVVDDVGQ